MLKPIEILGDVSFHSLIRYVCFERFYKVLIRLSDLDADSGGHSQLYSKKTNDVLRTDFALTNGSYVLDDD